MRRGDIRAPWPMRLAHPAGTFDPHDTGRLQPTLPGDRRGSLRPLFPWMDGFLSTSGVENTTPGPVYGGRQRTSGAGASDGRAVRRAGRNERDGGLRFDVLVPPGGYCWWYTDALSDDGRYGLTIIAFLGSVFSPYYAWAGYRDPFNHCAINVALYGPGVSRWSMTERGRRDLHWEPHILGIGPSALTWDGNSLKIDIDEIAVPFPRRLRGTVIVEPTGINPDEFLLEEKGHHIWRPIGPSSRVQVAFDKPGISWKGHGYLDMNRGDEPLAKGFSSWTWSRAKLDRGAAILYDAERRREDPLALALRFDNSGRYEKFEPPQRTHLPRTLWQVKRETRAENGESRVIRTLEDTPFYSRTEITSKLFGENVPTVHESLSMDRFQNPVVRMMLPFRMPRR